MIPTKLRPIISKIIYLYRSVKDEYSFNRGKNNKVIIHNALRVRTKIQIQGNENIILLKDNAYCLKSKIKILGSGNSVIIGKNTTLDNTTLWIEGNNCTLEIGDSCWIGQSHLAVTENESRLIIGDKCLISNNVNIRTGDSHSILDCNGNRINKAKSVYVSKHCWIGEGSKILKGVSLAEDTIVATGAIVTSSVSESGVILAGNPAKVIKTKIKWDAARL